MANGSLTFDWQTRTYLTGRLMMTSKIAIAALIITILGTIVFLIARANQARSNAAAKDSGDAGTSGVNSDSSSCSDGSSGGGCDGGGGGE